MHNSDRLQAAQEQFQQEKIRRKQKFEEERLQRIRDGKLGGVDVATLDNQIREKKQSDDNEKQQDEIMRHHYREVERQLAMQDEEEQKLRIYANTQLRQTWDEQRAIQERQRKIAMEEKDVDMDIAGASSLLIMEGADIYADKKKKEKQMFTREVLLNQMAENQSSKDNRSRDLEELEIIDRVNQIRDEAEAEEKQYTKYINDSVRDENFRLAEARRERMRKEAEEMKNASCAYAPLLDEDKSKAYDENGRIKSKDMFKGFTAAQYKTLLKENQDIIDANLKKKDYEAELDYQYAMQAEAQLRHLEEMEYEECGFNDTIKDEIMSTLKLQQAEAKKRKEEERAMRQEGCGPEFYANFGRTAR